VKEWRGDGWGKWRTEGWIEVRCFHQWCYIRCSLFCVCVCVFVCVVLSRLLSPVILDELRFVWLVRCWQAYRPLTGTEVVTSKETDIKTKRNSHHINVTTSTFPSVANKPGLSPPLPVHHLPPG